MEKAILKLKLRPGRPGTGGRAGPVDFGPLKKKLLAGATYPQARNVFNNKESLVL